MCHQSVGLIQSVIEKAGIPTVSISILKEVTRKVTPPRALFVDLPLGYPLGKPRDPAFQKRIIRAAFHLLRPGQVLPLLEEFGLEETGRVT